MDTKHGNQTPAVNANVLALTTLFVRESFAAEFDAAIKAGGTWDEILAAANKAAAEYKKRTGSDLKAYTGKKSEVIAQLKWRMIAQGKTDFLGKKQLTKDGIF